MELGEERAAGDESSLTGILPARRAMLDTVAGRVLGAGAAGVTRVGVDGVDGAGKTVFADELAAVLRARGVTTIRASVDGFHQPARIRHRRGRGSAEGFYRDSYDYARMRRLLLDPLGPGGDRRYIRVVYDVRTERALAPVTEYAGEGDVLVLDGIFLHRPELRDHWDVSVFLAVDFAAATPRVAARDGSDPDPDAPANRRYVDGQRLYLAECEPRRRATVVVDNTDLAAPRVLAG